MTLPLEGGIKKREDMTAVILAGGENRRLPVLKSCLKVDGRRIIDSNIELLKGLFDRVVISTNAPELYLYLGVPMIGDILRHRGPMTGIFSVLLGTGEPEVFVFACDMPFIKPELIRYIVDKYRGQRTEDRTQNSEVKKWDVVVPVFDRKPQPLFGIYSKNIINTVEERITRGQRGLREMLTELRVLYIKEEEVRDIDPSGRSFVNINTIEDYEREIGGKICLV